MVRKLKFHEQKLLKKVDFIKWKGEDMMFENGVILRYRLRREDFSAYVPHWVVCSALGVADCLYSYWKVAKKIKNLIAMLSKLEPRDPFRMEITDKFLDKLYVILWK